MENIVLGVGDFGVAVRQGEALKTFALGSCVAVIIYDPAAKAAGMAHVALPESKTNPKRAADKPGYFADTGLPALWKAFIMARGRPDKNGVMVSLVGGASIIKTQEKFNIGGRNVGAVRQGLKLLGLRLGGREYEDVGGSISRTVSIDVATGAVSISSPGRGTWTLGVETLGARGGK